MLDQNDVKIIKDLLREGIKEGIRPLEERISGIEKEMVKKSEFKGMFTEAFTEIFPTAFEKAFEPYASSIKQDFNNLEEKMSGIARLEEKMSSIEILVREIKATSVTEVDLSARLNRLNTEFTLIGREERGIIINLLKEKKIITEDEARRIMSIKIPIN